MGQSASIESVRREAKRKSARSAAKRMRIRRSLKLEQGGNWFDRDKKSKSSRLTHNRPNSEPSVKFMSSDDLEVTSQERVQRNCQTEGIIANESPFCNHVLTPTIGDAAVSTRTEKNFDAPGYGAPSYGLACTDPSVSQCVGSKTTGKDNDWNVSPWTMEKKFGESSERGAAESKTQSDVALPVRSVPLTATNVKQRSPDLTLPLENSIHSCAGISSHIKAKMTKTSKTQVTCPPKSTCRGERNTSCVRPIESHDQECSLSQVTQEYPVQIGSSVSYPGTIPRLVITPSPSPAPVPQTSDLGVGGEFLVQHPDEESPCSDSGCGGSPVPSLSFRKLSSSSSTCLSSASSFEESEDDLTGSDLEPNSLSPGSYNMLSSPDDVAGVSI